MRQMVKKNSLAPLFYSQTHQVENCIIQVIKRINRLFKALFLAKESFAVGIQGKSPQM